MEQYKEKKESRQQMAEDLKRFHQAFDSLDFEDKKGILEITEFILEDGYQIEISQSDKDKEAKLREMADILLALPRQNLATTYDILKEKLKTQENLADTLKTQEKNQNIE